MTEQIMTAVQWNGILAPKTGLADGPLQNEALNLRPLKNRLGRNGIYYGLVNPIDQDCNRIAGHTDLFRTLDKFERDLGEACARISALLLGVKSRAMKAEALDASGDTCDWGDAYEFAVEGLGEALRFMQEAYMLSEVLDDRERQRIKAQARSDFTSLVSTKAQESMDDRERFAEGCRLEWQINVLLDRYNQVAHRVRDEWPTIDRECLEKFNQRLEVLLASPQEETLEAMSSDDLQGLAMEIAGQVERQKVTAGTILSIIEKRQTIAL